MKLILVRHGETDRNKDKHHRLPGPVGINATGQKQAEALAKRLQQEQIDVIYCSDMLRAQQTTAAITRGHPDVQLIIDPQLRERDAGIFASRSIAEREEAEKTSGLGFRDWKPEGGESLHDVKHRAESCFLKLKTEHADQTVLVVSHGLFLYTFLEVAVEGGADVEREEYSMSNCGMTMLDIHPEGRARVIHLNDTSHLGDVRTLPSAIKSMIKTGAKPAHPAKG